MATLEDACGNNVQLTLTGGTLLTPFFFHARSRKAVIVPASVVPGTPYTAVPANQVGVDGLSISDANPAANTGLFTGLSMDNLGFSTGSIAFNSWTYNASTGTISSVSFPKLTDVFGTITIALPALTSFTAPSLTNVGSSMTIQSGSAASVLGSINLPALTYIAGLSLNVATGGTISLGAMTNVVATNFSFTGAAVLNLPALATMNCAQGCNITLAATAAAFSLPLLTTYTGNVWICNVGGVAAPGFPLLSKLALGVGSTFTLQGTGLTTVNLPSLLTATGAITAASAANLATVNLPQVTTLAGLTFTTGLGAVANVTINPALATASGNYNFAGQPLTAASVNSILVALANATGYVSGTVTLNGTGAAAPTGAGATAKSTLQGRGVTVNTN